MEKRVKRQNTSQKKAKSASVSGAPKKQSTKAPIAKKIRVLPSPSTLYLAAAPAKIGVRTVHKRPSSLRDLLMRGLEMLRNPVTGAIIAAPTPDYFSCWMRDQVYAALAYYYIGEKEKFVQSIHVLFDCIEQTEDKIAHAAKEKPWKISDHIHAKFHPITLREHTPEWGHHQVDAVGLFLFIIAFSVKQGLPILTSKKDKDMVQLLVDYLEGVKYAAEGDFGMWEENPLALRASSIGAAVAGLAAVKEMKLAVVKDSMIAEGYTALAMLLPNETAFRDTDMATLSLIWPYRVVSEDMAKEILARVKSKLVQEKGLNRYWGDEYYGRSKNGVSAEWPLGFFWLAIIESDLGDTEKAKYWFKRGMSTMTDDGYLPELCIDGKGNDHTPLAWTHSFAAIAHEKIMGTAKKDK